MRVHTRWRGYPFISEERMPSPDTEVAFISSWKIDSFGDYAGTVYHWVIGQRRSLLRNKKKKKWEKDANWMNWKVCEGNHGNRNVNILGTRNEANCRTCQNNLLSGGLRGCVSLKQNWLCWPAIKSHWNFLSICQFFSPLNKDSYWKEKTT